MVDSEFIGNTKYKWDNVYYEDSTLSLDDFPINCFDIAFLDQPWNKNIQEKSEGIVYNDNIENYEEWCRSWFPKIQKISKSQIMVPGNDNIEMWYNIKPYRDKFYHIATNRKKKFTSLTNKNGVDIYLLYGDFNNKRLPANFILDPVVWGWMIKNEEDRIEHPDPKNPEVLKYFFKYFKPKTVLDPFLGSGITASVCEIMNIKYIGFELNKEFKPTIDKLIKKGRIKKQPKIKTRSVLGYK